MASSHETVSMAVFCDFENVALGVRDARYEKFDIARVLERLLLKGSIVIKKAYCDWDRYKAYKETMHEANFELIEIPHVRQSGKNSADIRLVVDALDLCYTKSHIDTFVIISGDSDFSPLVSKLRENDKQVIGVGVKQSTSDLLIANCDEFIFYDDLVRESERQAKRSVQETQTAARPSPGSDAASRADQEKRKSRAIGLTVETFEALVSERGDSGKIWASTLKQAIKRRKPDFNESYYGFRAFGNLLEEASARGLLEIGRDEKSGTYVYRSNGGEKPAGEAERTAAAPAAASPSAPATAPVTQAAPSAAADKQHAANRRTRASPKTSKPGETAAAPARPDIILPDGAAAKEEAGKVLPAKPADEAAGKPGARPAPRTARTTRNARPPKPAAEPAAGPAPANAPAPKPKPEPEPEPGLKSASGPDDN